MLQQNCFLDLPAIMFISNFFQILSSEQMIFVLLRDSCYCTLCLLWCHWFSLWSFSCSHPSNLMLTAVSKFKTSTSLWNNLPFWNNIFSSEINFSHFLYTSFSLMLVEAAFGRTLSRSHFLRTPFGFWYFLWSVVKVFSQITWWTVTIFNGDLLPRIFL